MASHSLRSITKSVGLHLYLLFSFSSGLTAETILERYPAKTGTAEWAYYKMHPVNKNNDSAYVPQASAINAAIFQGYVATPPNPYFWTNANDDSNLGNEDTVRVLSTQVHSDRNQTLSLLLDGDDGHSVFIDRRYVGGGASAVKVEFSLELKAGVPVELLLAGYNGPGAWNLCLRSQGAGEPLAALKGITLRANRDNLSVAGEALAEVHLEDQVVPQVTDASKIFAINNQSKPLSEWMQIWNEYAFMVLEVERKEMNGQGSRAKRISSYIRRVNVSASVINRRYALDPGTLRSLVYMASGQWNTKNKEAAAAIDRFLYRVEEIAISQQARNRSTQTATQGVGGPLGPLINFGTMGLPDFGAGSVHVRGHYRNGSYVEPHYRSMPRR